MVDLEWLLSRLRPLIPREVASWKASLPHLDGGTRQLLEQHVHARAQHLLGDVESKIMLPPPPGRLARGSLKLGEIVYPGLPRYSFGLKEDELLQGLGIYGRSGSGKTTAVFALLRELAKKRINFLFLDWKRTCRHLLPYLSADLRLFTPGRSVAPFNFNPLIPPPGMERRSYVRKVVDIMASAYTLGDGAKNVLQRELVAAYERTNAWPTFAGVLESLEGVDGSGRSKGWRESAIRALQSLTLGGLEAASEAAQHDLMQGLGGSSSVIELDGLGDNDKRALIPLLLQWLYEVRLQGHSREELELVVVIEEAHHVLYRSENRSKESVTNQFLRQCRELGIGVVIVDQHPHLISSAALGNTFTSICLNMTEPSDLNRAAAISLLRSHEKRFLGMLPVGFGIVRLRDRWNAPFLLQVDHLGIKKGAVTDEALRRRGGRWTGSSARGAGMRGIRDVPRVPLEDGPSHEALRLLEDAVQHPANGMRQRYARLGFSSRKGTALKSELIATGWAETAVIPVGRSRRVVLGPTRHARRALGLNTEATWGSIEHRFWQHYWAGELRVRGYDVEIEVPRHGGRVDVLATRDGERVAVEIETGKSRAVSNAEACLRSRFERVLVVATSEKAKRKVKTQLEEAALLNRVELIVGAGRGREVAS